MRLWLYEYYIRGTCILGIPRVAPLYLDTAHTYSVGIQVLIVQSGELWLLVYSHRLKLVKPFIFSLGLMSLESASVTLS